MSQLILPDDQPVLQLYDYQKRWINDPARFKAAMFSRQSGKTFTSTLEIALDCAKADAEKRRVRWVILSRGERQAKEAMNEGLKVHLNALKAGYQAYEYDFDIDTRALEVELPYGSKVTALPANPDTARGFSANVFLDEFAIHKDSRAIWGALFPVVSKKGLKLRVVSTPKGKGNKFYEIMTAESAVWSRHVVDIHQAVAEGLDRNIPELRAGLNDDELWAQEYELQWLDAASAWLDFDLINSCEYEDAGKPEKYSGGMCFVGVDIAARNDLFVIWVIEQVGDVFWTREIIERKRISFAEQDMLLDDVFNRYKVIRCCIDQTGMGEKPVEDAQRRYGTTRVEGVLFNANTKLNMATRGKECFQDRRIRIPEGNLALRADLHKIKKVVSNTGTPRFLADSDSAGHADRTWALFLALNATEGGFISDRIITGRPRAANNLLRGYR